MREEGDAIISLGKFKLLKETPNSAYTALVPLFLYQSNHMEGSTFTLDEVETLYATGVVMGEHDFDDIVETRNSFKVFDMVIDTLGEPLSDGLLIRLETTLHRGTSLAERGESGHYKFIPNRIRNSNVQVALPSDLPRLMPELFDTWERSARDLDAIIAFHIRFEHLHPFQDGNGRIGRMLMLKQCIECGVDLVMVTDELAKPYKSWLEIAQTTGETRFFKQTIIECQQAFDQCLAQSGLDRMIRETPEPEVLRNMIERGNGCHKHDT